jgi:hypothetical protein
VCPYRRADNDIHAQLAFALLLRINFCANYSFIGTARPILHA